MPEVIFADPEGGPFRLTTADEMFELVATRGESYWNNPEESGFSSLTFCPKGWVKGRPQTARLDFTMKDDFGFHFYYVMPPNCGMPTANLFSSTGFPFADVAEVNWAGGLRKIYSCLFIPEEQAFKVFQQFCEDGMPTTNIAWISPADVPDLE